MNAAPIESIAERLDRLERACRRWRAAGLCALTASAVFALAGARRDAVPEAVEARRFLIRDEDGRLRATLQLDAMGLPGLWLFDRRGQVKARLALSGGETPTLELHDKQGKGRVILGVSPTDQPGLALSGQDGKTGMHLSVFPGPPAGGTPILFFTGPDGKSRIDLTSTAGEFDTLSFQGKDQKPRIILQTDRFGRPTLKFLNADGETIFEAPAKP